MHGYSQRWMHMHGFFFIERMLYDLNVAWPSDKVTELPAGVFKTLIVLQDLGYTGVALNLTVGGKITPKSLTNPIDKKAISEQFPGLTIWTRLTIVLDDVSQNVNFTTLYSQFDIIAIRPQSEKTLQSACTGLDIDLISLDVGYRLPFYLKHKTVCAAVERGIKFEICYGCENRKNVISNASSIIRATRRRGIIISSEATSPLQCKSPYDVTNMAVLWGLDHMHARDAVGKSAAAVVQNATLRSSSYKQVVQNVS